MISCCHVSQLRCDICDCDRPSYMQEASGIRLCDSKVLMTPLDVLEVLLVYLNAVL